MRNSKIFRNITLVIVILASIASVGIYFSEISINDKIGMIATAWALSAIFVYILDSARGDSARENHFKEHLRIMAQNLRTQKSNEKRRWSRPCHPRRKKLA